MTEGRKAPNGAKVIDLSKQKTKRLVLEAFDRIHREKDKQSREHKAEVQMAAKKRL